MPESLSELLSVGRRPSLLSLKFRRPLLCLREFWQDACLVLKGASFRKLDGAHGRLALRAGPECRLCIPYYLRSAHDPKRHCTNVFSAHQKLKHDIQALRATIESVAAEQDVSVDMTDAFGKLTVATA